MAEPDTREKLLRPRWWRNGGRRPPHRTALGKGAYYGELPPAIGMKQA
jgi:hypothetical protein